MRGLRRGAAALLALALVSPPVAVGQSEALVEMRDDVFAPATLRAEAGVTVRWVNRGRNPHDVVADDASFASPILQPGESFTWRFPKAAAFPYYCSLHGIPGRGMIGVVLAGGEVQGYERGNIGGLGSHTRQLPDRPPERPVGGRTIRVPGDVATIQSAVDRAAPGDLVLVAPGIYREAVRVTTPHLTLRGEDRNRVILDGGFALKNGVAVFGADGVVVENMTARHYELNGFYWRSVWGYRGSYLTAYGNGDYGLYAFDSGVGQFDHSYASGHPDSGFYIGQCDPCNAVISDVIATHNAIGYSGTNASGNLVIKDSQWYGNMVGIVPNTLDSEALAPQHGVTIVRNRVAGNHDRTAPAKRRLSGLLGNGILLLGANANEVAYNLVDDHPYAGIAALPSIDEHLWLGGANRVHNNAVSRSGLADLAIVAPASAGNCFERNQASTTLPLALETLYGCGSPLTGIGGGDVGLFLNGIGLYLRSFTRDLGGDWKAEPEPPPQPSMPDSAATPGVAGPLKRVDVSRDRGVGGVGPGGRFDFSASPSPTLGNTLLLLHGTAPLLVFVVLLAAVLFRRGRRRLLLVPPIAYVATGALIFALAFLR